MEGTQKGDVEMRDVERGLRGKKGSGTEEGKKEGKGGMTVGEMRRACGDVGDMEGARVEGEGGDDVEMAESRRKAPGGAGGRNWVKERKEAEAEREKQQNREGAWGVRNQKKFQELLERIGWRRKSR